MTIVNMTALQELYDRTMAQADPRLDGYPLMDSPLPMLTCTGIYLAIVIVGPKLMVDRKPFDLRTTIIIYNFALVILSAYISLATAFGMYKAGGYSISCDRIDKYKDSGYFYVNIGYIFFLSKIIEYWDTFFFILRKKNRQISFLHVYHHSTMTVFTWLGVKFMPGGSNIVYPLINSYIHAVMYTYYGLSACGPRMAKYLWWKKYLTKMQITQFVLFLTQGFINYYYECPLPKVFVYAVYIYTFTILLLFINFYVRAYLEKAHKNNLDKFDPKRLARKDLKQDHYPSSNGVSTGRVVTRSMTNGHSNGSNGTTVVANGNHKKLN